jgi:peptide/nickel transport system substrate-binding protein/oligopeptide transport system substrate-binding protein
MSKKFTTRLLPTLLVLMAMLLVACGGSGGSGTTTSGGAQKAPQSQQIFRWAFRLPDINSFDPGIAPDQNSINAINMVFTGLVSLDDQLRVVPQMASSWDVSSDHMTYTFHLKSGLQFSDGTKLDANDVAYSIDRSLSPAINNQSGVGLTYLGLIQGSTDRTTGKAKTIIGTGVVVQDPNTLVIHLTKPAGYFLQALTYPTAYVVEKSVADKYGTGWTDHLVGQGGDGPFMVKSYSHTTGIVFVPNPNYYGAKPQLAEVDYLPFKDRQTSYNAYQANQNDYSVLPLAQVASAKSGKDFVQTPALTIFYVGMNFLVKPLDNIKVRQAFALAVDRDVLNQAAWHGAYIPSCHIIPQGMPGYNANLTCPEGTTTKGDAAKAKQLFTQGLQEEGMTLATFPTITYTYPTQSPESAAQATTLVQMWKTALGVTINATAKSQNSMYTLESQTTKHNGPLQMWSGGWGADYPDPQDWITLQFGDNQPYNEFNFGDNNGNAQQIALQKQMDAADVMTDQNARIQAYQTIEQQLVNYVTWLSIYQRPEIHVLKTYVVGLKENPEAQFGPDSWANVYIAQH